MPNTAFIHQLDDTTAMRILGTIARSRPRTGADDVECNAQLARQMAEAFDLPAATSPAPRVTDGDLARQALLFLAQDPVGEAAIRAMSEAPGRTQFDFGTSIAVTTAILILLQTHVRIERDVDGKWSFLIEKHAARDPLLKPLIQKLAQFFGQ